VGQVAPGEPPTLANDRARAVVDAIVQQGVDRRRLMPITATVSVYGQGTENQIETHELRRVIMRSILRRSPSTDPAAQ
jgi:hypothetical protein